MNFFIRFFISAMSLALAAYLVPGIHIQGLFSVLVAAFLLGILNAFVRPILVLLTLPITLLTMGLFILVINALTFGLTAWLLPGFTVAGFGSAILGALLTSFVGWLATSLIT